MSGKHSFVLESRDHQRRLPQKIIIGRQEGESMERIALKFIGFLYFFRERIQIETSLHNDSIPFTPDLVQLDYELRPVLWVECGDCEVAKLKKIAIKVPEAEIWVLTRSSETAANLIRVMTREKLKKNRYHILALDESMFVEISGMIKSRNEIFWFKCNPDSPEMQFDFNSVWFELPFQVFHY